MLPTCDDNFFKVSPGFYSWKTFAFRTGLKDDIWMEERGERWPGQIMAQKAVGPSNLRMDPAERAAYDAPYPDDTFKAGARMFPELVPTPSTDPTSRPTMTEAENNAAAWGVFQNFTKPVLLAFSDEDTVMAGGRRNLAGALPRDKAPRRGARHDQLLSMTRRRLIVPVSSISVGHQYPIISAARIAVNRCLRVRLRTPKRV